ncbi:hypothetical protein MXL46_16840 [Heyndrickxia sporothermodurans]|uniref:hypothetical protein n=1 Tax=Heyndrickxia sporothermodurans TaxID=46224 RepID=UPI002DB6A629|nr:hypothetical protein [Heyndrickxia sporothermodurans]MEB6550735.1 hypothetical protein [Heyndrickxia sporothermodurans]
MKRLPFERPTKHYDENIRQIDEQICALIQQRKDVSNANPSFPPKKYISEWADKYNLYEDLLHDVFGTLRNDEAFRPQVEPNKFQKYVSLMKSVAKDEYFYSVAFMRQYDNATVVNFTIDWDDTKDFQDDHIRRHHFWELFIEEYDCRMTNGGGSGGHFSYNFVVSPPLPDDLSGLQFVFKAYKEPYTYKETPILSEIIIDMD